MKWCPKCGRQLSDDTVYCSGCGTALNGAPQQPGYPPQQPYGYQQPGYPPQQPYGYQQPYAAPDVPSTGMNVLAFLIPIVGLILYLVEKDKSPIKANAIGKWALIGFCVNLALTVFTSILPFMFF